MAVQYPMVFSATEHTQWLGKVHVQSACAKVSSSSMLIGSLSETRAMHDMQNHKAWIKARNFVKELPLLLSLTPSTKLCGRSWGSCLSKSDMLLAVIVNFLQTKGSRLSGSTAIPPMMAQKLWLIVHGYRLPRGWLSGSSYISRLSEFDMIFYSRWWDTSAFPFNTKVFSASLYILLAVWRWLHAVRTRYSGAKSLRRIQLNHQRNIN